ncbi:hypothetical protein KAR91_79440 [Candidatus Pacearchaeota archaeon]|nr:hypothetical protein [Candidatus Pacearchaeota archaeon]
MIKRFDKRGQEGIGGGFLIKLIVGALAAGLVIWGGYMYFQTVTSPVDVDIDLVLMEQSCSNFLVGGTSQYCAGKYEAATDKFVGCVYAVDNLGLVIDYASVSPSGSKPTCEGKTGTQINKEICLKVQLEKGLDSFEGEKIYVNNQLCSDIIGTPAADEEIDEETEAAEAANLAGTGTD